MADKDEDARARARYESMPNAAAKAAYMDAEIALRQARVHQKSGDKVGERQAAADLRSAMARTSAAMQSTHDMSSDVPHPMTKRGENR